MKTKIKPVETFQFYVACSILLITISFLLIFTIITKGTSLYIGASILSQNNCFRLLDGLPPITKPLSIPHIIEILTTQRLLDMNCYEIQENRRNIWEQTEKKFLRAYYSKRGSLNPNAK